MREQLLGQLDINRPNPYLGPSPNPVEWLFAVEQDAKIEELAEARAVLRQRDALAAEAAARAAAKADADGGGTVDFDEFTALFAKVKKGEVKGLGGGSSFFGSPRRKKKELEDFNAEPSCLEMTNLFS